MCFSFFSIGSKQSSKAIVNEESLLGCLGNVKKCLAWTPSFEKQNMLGKLFDAIRKFPCLFLVFKSTKKGDLEPQSWLLR